MSRCLPSALNPKSTDKCSPWSRTFSSLPCNNCLLMSTQPSLSLSFYLIFWKNAAHISKMSKNCSPLHLRGTLLVSRAFRSNHLNQRTWSKNFSTNRNSIYWNNAQITASYKHFLTTLKNHSFLSNNTINFSSISNQWARKFSTTCLRRLSKTNTKRTSNSSKHMRTDLNCSSSYSYYRKLMCNGFSTTLTSFEENFSSCVSPSRKRRMNGAKAMQPNMTKF